MNKVSTLAKLYNTDLKTMTEFLENNGVGRVYYSDPLANFLDSHFGKPLF